MKGTLTALFLVMRLAVPWTGVAALQLNDPSPTQAECDTATDSSVNGARFFWEVLPWCGSQGGFALAFGIQQAAGTTDSMFVSNMLATTSSIRHPNILLRARQLAVDGLATREARIMALLVLLNQYQLGWGVRPGLSWNELTSSPPQRCPLVGGIGHDDAYAFEDIPTNFKEQIAETTEAVSNDTNAHPAVRFMARCVREIVAYEIPIMVPLWQIRLFYLCRNRFKVTNSSNEWVQVSYRVNGTTDSAAVGSVAPGGEKLFITLESDSTTIFYRGKIVDTKANGGTPCT